MESRSRVNIRPSSQARGPKSAYRVSVTLYARGVYGPSSVITAFKSRNTLVFENVAKKTRKRKKKRRKKKSAHDFFLTGTNRRRAVGLLNRAKSCSKLQKKKKKLRGGEGLGANWLVTLTVSVLAV